jgi:hypothetical protein
MAEAQSYRDVLQEWHVAAAVVSRHQAQGGSTWLG